VGIVVSAVLLILLTVLLIRDIRPNRAPLIFVLRILMIALMSLILLGFIFRRAVRERPGVDLLILADESQSMSLGRKLADETDALSTLPNKPQWHVGYYGFGDTTRKLADVRSINPIGKRTDIGQALQMAKSIMPGGAVIVSDGQHNASGDPAQLAAKFGFPVYTVGVGRIAVKDLSIERIRSANRAVLGDTVPLIVRVGSRGFAGEHVRLRLLDNGQTVETRDMTLTADESRQELEYRVVAAPEGRHVYRVLADSMLGEDSYANNQAQTALQVVPSRTRVIYVTNHPDFNSRFLIQLLKSNRNIDLIPLVALAGTKLQRITDQGMIPYSLTGTIDADVMILDNVDENELGVSDALSSFAANHGLLVLVGERFRAGRSLSALLPIAFSGDRISRELPVELTEEGRGNPIFFEGARNLLSAMPPFWGAIRGTGLQSNARLWAKAPDGTPLIAFRRIGQGKILEIAGYPLWRAGFSAQAVEANSDNLYRFLANAIRFLALKDVDRFRLSSDKLDYYAGEPISVLLQATSEDGKPWTGLDVRLSVAAESSGPSAVGGRQSASSQSMVERGDGLYEAVVEGLSSGRYAANADVFVREQPQGTVEHSFTVSELSLELSQIGLNDELLKRIAQASGGEYVPYDSLRSKNLNIHFAEYKRLITFDPRLNRYLFLLIAALFVIEVFLRKRRGMM
jgi:hypothetical protein